VGTEPQHRSTLVNSTVILPQRSSPPIPAMVVVDFHIGTQSMTLRRKLHAGAGKVSPYCCCHLTHPMVCVGDDSCGAARRTVAIVQRVQSLFSEKRECTRFAPQISIVTQCDVKRFRERIPEMMRVWRGPMVVVVMMRSMAEMDDVLTTVKENRFLTQCVPYAQGG
jgi:hypothetical protein